MKICKQYKDLLKNILDNGVWREDPNREGTKRLQIPFTTMSIDLREGFPLLTTKKMWWKGIVIETLWLLRGESNIKYLVENGVNIWNKDAYNHYKEISKYHNSGIDFKSFINYIKKGDLYYEDDSYKLGDIGRMYGVQWRKWNKGDWSKYEEGYNSIHEFKGINQLQKAINTIKTNPLSSNIRIFGDNPADAGKQALPCCMDYMQFSCEPVNLPDFDKSTTYKTHYLDLTIHYRSWDVLLGCPFNIAQYALILEIIAKLTNKVPRNLNIVANNVHLYDNQIEAAKEQIERSEDKYNLPELKMSPIILANLEHKSLDSMLLNSTYEQFILKDYKSYPKLTKQPEMKSYE